MKKETRKELKISFIIIVIIIVFALIFPRIMYVNSSIVCGKVYERHSIRGSDSFDFKFKIDGETLNNNVPVGFIKKNVSYDSIKKIECLKVEYSNYSTLFSRIVDERVLRK